MNACALRLALLLGWLAAPGVASRAAEEPEPETKSHMKEVLRARMAEEANKKPAPAQPTPTQPVTAPEQKSEQSAPPAKSAIPAAKEEKKPVKTAEQPATVLPKVEVKKGRITELDQQIAKQEQDIAREKKNTKPTETDLALNDSKIAKPLAIFGGDSAQFRKRVASERVELMEAEKDILEAMKLAKTKEEKAKLQKELDELRAVRRDLEKSLR